MVGTARIKDSETVDQHLEELRQQLLKDPYFKDVPSMQPEAKKTALAFHAKDDLPEVRREVYKLIQDFDVKVTVAIRRKYHLATGAKDKFRRLKVKFDENSVYDGLISRIFRDKLHKAEQNIIVFAQRGKRKRQRALRKALEKAQKNFERKWGKPSDKPIKILSSYPDTSGGLQVIDYYLWALQRLYERREERFFAALADDFRLVMDLDDTRNKGYGEWYTDQNPLSLKKIKPVSG